MSLRLRDRKVKHLVVAVPGNRKRALASPSVPEPGPGPPQPSWLPGPSCTLKHAAAIGVLKKFSVFILLLP